MGQLWRGEGSPTYCPWCVSFLTDCRGIDEEDWEITCPRYKPEITILSERGGEWHYFADSNEVSMMMNNPDFLDEQEFSELQRKGEVIINSGTSGIFKIIKRWEATS